MITKRHKLLSTRDMTTKVAANGIRNRTRTNFII